MRVKSIERKNYMIPGEHRLDLPERGLVLITGGNGTGKSSWIDAIGSVWNLTLRDPKARKSRGNLEGESAYVKVVTYDGAKIDRVWSKAGKCGLEWSLDGKTDTGTTRSKSQSALIANLGDFQGWRWADVITSDSADSFTTATPANRRKILEDVLDLHLLSAAYIIAHEDTKEFTRDLKEQERALIAAQDSHLLIQQAAESAHHARAGLGDPVLPSRPEALSEPREPSEPLLPRLVLPDLPQDQPLPQEPTGAPEDKREILARRIKELEVKRSNCADELERLSVARRDIDIQLGKARNDVKAAEESRARIAHDKCPTCAQEISRETAASFEDEVRKQRTKHENLRKSCEEHEQDILAATATNKQQLEAYGAELSQLSAELQANTRELDKYAQNMQAYERELQRAKSANVANAAQWEAACAKLRKEHDAQVAQLTKKYEQELEQYAQDMASLVVRQEALVVSWEANCREVMERHEAHKSALDTAERDAQERCDKSAATLSKAILAKDETERKLRLSLAAEKVLGPAGPRATLLNDAMKSIEAHANRVLSAVGSHIRVELYAEDKDVGLRVTGECATEYVDLSNGERRRVDLAVLLALGEVASNTRGQEAAGTLFLDEFLDAVDHDGLQDVCDYVMWLSTKRCVVVVTHREEVATRLQPTKKVVMRR